MQDPRATSSFKAFDACRQDRGGFTSVLTKYSQLGGKVDGALRAQAIGAMAQGESCLRASAAVDLSEAPKGLKAALSEAIGAYRAREAAEAKYFGAVIIGSQGEMAKSYVRATSAAIVEAEAFSGIYAIEAAPPSYSTPFLAMAIPALAAGLALRGYLRGSAGAQKAPGLTRFVLGIFGGLYSGVRSEVAGAARALKKGDKDV
jgi:hypothetical protein